MCRTPQSLGTRIACYRVNLEPIMGLRVGRSLGEAAGSAACFFGVLAALAMVDARVRERIVDTFRELPAIKRGCLGLCRRRPLFPARSGRHNGTEQGADDF